MGGGGGSTQTVRKRDPESAELQNLQAGIYNLLAPILGLQASGTGAGSAAGAGANAGVGAVSRPVTGTSGGASSGMNDVFYDPNSGRYYVNDTTWITDDEVETTRPRYLSDSEAAAYQRSRAAQQAANSSGGGNAAAQGAANWAATQFGNTWNDLGNRSDDAIRAYEAALAAEPGLQRNVLNATAGLQNYADQMASLSKDAQAALQPNINRINQNAGLITGIGNQLAALAPEAQAALQPNIRNMNDVSGKLSGLGDTINSAASGYANESGNLNKKIEGVGDRQGDLASTIWNFTETGNIPEEMKRNLMNTVNSELRTNTGSTLNDLAARGVMNSTVANRSINNLSNAAADAYAKNYMDAYNAVLGGYGQTNNTLASQADTYAKVRAGLDTGWNNQLAGYDAARNAWNSALGGYEGANNQITQGFNNRMNALNNAGQQYQNAIGGYNTANNNITQGYNSRLSGLSSAADTQNKALVGYQQAYGNNQNKMTTMAAMPQTLAQSAWSKYQPVYDFWKSMRQSYDNKEDYDTIVKQGK